MLSHAPIFSLDHAFELSDIESARINTCTHMYINQPVPQVILHRIARKMPIKP